MPWMPALQSPRGPVYYDSSDHCQILFQCFGSLWPRVLPYCAANALLMALLTKLQQQNYVDWKISGQGHAYAGMIVSFLIVSRINTALTRYNECRGYIGTMYRETRELIQTAFALTRGNPSHNRDMASKEWRNELAYRTMLMLRTAIAVTEYPTTGIPAYDVPELSGYELEYCTPTMAWRRHAITPTSETAESMRIPLRLAYLTRETICSHSHRLQTPLAVPQELKLMGSVDSFMNGFYGMRKFITTPVPFPLIQMTRTIVLFYVYSLPLIFLNDNSSNMLIEHCIVVFLLTYGFVGLELVSIELDDPFGKDENDFDVIFYARMCFEDTYLIIHETDGMEWADLVRYRMHERTPPCSSKTDYSDYTEGTELLHETMSV